MTNNRVNEESEDGVSWNKYFKQKKRTLFGRKRKNTDGN